MSANPGAAPYALEEGEKTTPIMAYTQNMLVLGDVVTKDAIRVSIWLRTSAIPSYILIYGVRVVRFSEGSLSKPEQFSELHLPSSQIIAFHIKPPAQEPLDYDANEPMRKMHPTIALVGAFRFDGYLRMSTHTNLERFLDAAKEAFIGMYDISITQPGSPATGAMKIPYAVLRKESVMFLSNAR
ncbi:MAG: hypothetical protein JXB15_12370 [Anaerolineales bacterium]|nr:hypothetical protein [Anaerolineales bacterium]